MTFATSTHYRRLTGRLMTALHQVARPVVAGFSLSLISLLVSSTVATAEPSIESGLVDGVHLFGEHPDISELGATYMVVEVTEDTVLGGFYQHNSSFDCFHGEMRNRELALTIRDSYDQTEYPHTVALTTAAGAIASRAEGGGSLVPTDFYRLPALDSTAEQVLQVCRGHI